MRDAFRPLDLIGDNRYLILDDGHCAYFILLCELHIACGCDEGMVVSHSIPSPL